MKNTEIVLRAELKRLRLEPNPDHELYSDYREIAEYIDQVFSGTGPQRVADYIDKTLRNYEGFLRPASNSAEDIVNALANTDWDTIEDLKTKFNSLKSKAMAWQEGK